ncbi:MAG: methyl-accepting chemotaxis protein [Candidatus Heimdallarchaeota archaeon]
MKLNILSNFKLRTQLMAMFLIFAMVPMAAIGLATYIQGNTMNSKSQYEVEQEVYAKLKAVATDRAYMIDNYFFERQGDLHAMAKSSIVINGTRALTDGNISANNGHLSDTAAKGQLNEYFNLIIEEYGTYWGIMLLNASNGVPIAGLEVVDATLSSGWAYEEVLTGGAVSFTTDEYFTAVKAAPGTAANPYVHFKDMYLSSTIGAVSSTFSTGIFIDGTLAAVLVERINSHTWQDLICYKLSNGQADDESYIARGMGDTGETYLVHSDSKLFVSKSRFGADADVVLQMRVDTVGVGEALSSSDGTFQGIYGDYTSKSEAEAGGREYSSSLGGVPVLGYTAHLEDLEGTRADLNWVMVSEIDEKEAFAGTASINNEFNSLIILILGIVVVAVVAILGLAFLIASSISGGLRVMVEAMKQGATGDLTVTEEDTANRKRFESRNDEVGELAGSYNVFLSALRDIIHTTQETSMKVASTSEELASTAEEINASTEEVSATVEHIARGAGQQAEMATKAIDNVGRMSETVDTSLREIEGTSSVIQDIAGQTNMLALNAAIEAARAGEYGRGFGVVADNVRVLAENSRSSANEINAITTNIVTDVGGSVGTIQESVQSIASVAEEFSASAEEVSSAVEEMSASMEEMSSSAQELSGLSEQLSDVVGRFKI